MPYFCTKTYSNDLGLSCCFRQWKADSHCSFLHGYAIGVKLTFKSEQLDHRNWVYNFGGLKKLEEWLRSMFDHTVIIAEDDPEKSTFENLASLKLINLRIIKDVSCEKFAELVFNKMNEILSLEVKQNSSHQVELVKVEVFEHGANSAAYGI